MARTPAPRLTKAELEEQIAGIRKVGIICGVASLASFPFLLITFFFLTGMTGGPFDGFARAMVWPMVFLVILASPLLLAFAFVQTMRIRALRENNK